MNEVEVVNRNRTKQVTGVEKIICNTLMTNTYCWEGGSDRVLDKVSQKYVTGVIYWFSHCRLSNKT